MTHNTHPNLWVQAPPGRALLSAVAQVPGAPDPDRSAKEDINAEEAG
jgi:hypothetical protein